MLSKQLFSPFISLGRFLQNSSEQLDKVCKKAELENPWFSQEQILFALKNWSHLLTEENFNKWSDKYSHLENNSTRKLVGVIMAGNIPMVGFHDLLSILLSGHNALVKLSSDDTVLMKFLIDYLTENGLPSGSIEIVNRLEKFDAVIATGSNNTNRYFEYYFSKVPNLLRKNRTSIAVLTGKETKEQLTGLGNDIFRYFGLGCRNVAKLYVPANYDLATFFEAVFDYGWLMEHNKYMNNHDYYRAIYLLNQESFLDNNFVLVKEEKHLHSPISVTYYEHYQTIKELLPVLKELRSELQCVVAETGEIPGEIPFGSSQQPALWDYADGVDTIDFLHKI